MRQKPCSCRFCNSAHQKMMMCLMIIIIPACLHHVVHNILMDQKFQESSKHQHLQSQKIIKAAILKTRCLPLSWFQVFSLKVNFLKQGYITLDFHSRVMQWLEKYLIAMFYFLFWCGSSFNLCSFPGSLWKTSTCNLSVCVHGFKLNEIVWNLTSHGRTVEILWRSHCSKSERIHWTYSKPVQLDHILWKISQRWGEHVRVDVIHFFTIEFCTDLSIAWFDFKI